MEACSAGCFIRLWRIQHDKDKALDLLANLSLRTPEPQANVILSPPLADEESVMEACSAGCFIRLWRIQHDKDKHWICRRISHSGHQNRRQMSF